MYISFNPPLAKPLQICIPQPHTENAFLLFSATLSSRDYDILQRDGAKIQLWSDIPRYGYNADGWNDYDFQYSSPSDPLSHHKLSIGNATTEDTSCQQSLHLQIPVSLPSTSHLSKFSFTYRLVYPSGEPKWLGQFGENGTIVLERGAPLIAFGDGWAEGDEGSLMWASSRPVENQTVASFNSWKNFTIWATGKQSFSHVAEDASLILLIPKQTTQPVIVQPSYLLSSSPGSTLTLTSAGELVMTGSGSVLAQTHDLTTNTQNFVERALAHSSSACRLVSSDEAGNIVLLMATDNYPTHVLVAPLLAGSTNKGVEVEMHRLITSIPSDVPQFSIFSSQSLDIRFFDRAEDEKKMILFSMDYAGERFVVSPVYDLNARGQRSAITFLTSYESIRENTATLPTPPPSPRARSIVTLNDSQVASSTTKPDVAHTSVSNTSLPRGDGSKSQAQAISRPFPKSLYARYVAVLAAMILATVYRWFYGTAAPNGLYDVHHDDGAGREIPEQDRLLNDDTTSDSQARLSSKAEVNLGEDVGEEAGDGDGSVEERDTGLDRERDVIPDSTSFAVKVGPGTGMFALRPREPDAVVSCDAVLEASGQKLVTKKVKKSGDAYLVEFDGGKGGWVTVALEFAQTV